MKFNLWIKLLSASVLLVFAPAVYAAGENELSIVEGGSDVIDAQMGWDFTSEAATWQDDSIAGIDTATSDETYTAADSRGDFPPDPFTAEDNSTKIQSAKTSTASAEDKGIYDPTLPENGTPFHPATLFEPRGKDDNYGKAVIQYFGREIKLDKLPFDYVDVYLGGRNIPVFFFSSDYRKEEWPGAAFALYDSGVKSVLVNTKEVAQTNSYDEVKGLILGSKSPQETESLMLQILATEAKDLKRSEQIKLSVQGSFYHELIHAVIDALVQEQLVSGKIPEGIRLSRNPAYHQQIVSETGAYLGQLAVSPTPKTDLLGISLMSSHFYGVAELFAGSSIESMLFKKLGGVEYVTNRIIEQKENENDGYVSEEEKTAITNRIKEAYAEGRFWPDKQFYEMEYLKSLSAKEIAQAAAEEYQRLFQQPLPAKDVVDLIPQEVYDKILKR